MSIRGAVEGINQNRQTRVWGEQSGKIHNELTNLLRNELGATSDEMEQLKTSNAVKNTQGDDTAPYSYLADANGMIEYNGVVYRCNGSNKQLELGDVSNPKDCIKIPLSKGGTLVVNRDNIGQLSKSIGMFSPEDVKLILNALSLDAKLRSVKNEQEEEEAKIGESEGQTTELPEEDPKIPIGAAAYSVKEWNKLMERMDVLLKQMRDGIKQQEEDRVKKEEQQQQLQKIEERKQNLEAGVGQSGDEIVVDQSALALLFMDLA